MRSYCNVRIIFFVSNIRNNQYYRAISVRRKRLFIPRKYSKIRRSQRSCNIVRTQRLNLKNVECSLNDCVLIQQTEVVSSQGVLVCRHLDAELYKNIGYVDGLLGSVPSLIVATLNEVSSFVNWNLHFCVREMVIYFLEFSKSFIFVMGYL